MQIFTQSLANLRYLIYLVVYIIFMYGMCSCLSSTIYLHVHDFILKYRAMYVSPIDVVLILEE